MSALVLWFALSAPRPEEWHEALAAGEFRRAWALAEQLHEPVRRARAEAQIRYQAGDPSGALAAAEAGLARAPAELELLFYASGAALWMQEAEPALLYTGRLEGALDQAQLASEARDAWQATARSHRGDAEALARKEAARDRAVSVARAVSLFGLGAALAALTLLSRRQGRSSSPVS
jgi:hypothetical protein